MADQHSDFLFLCFLIRIYFLDFSLLGKGARDLDAGSKPLCKPVCGELDSDDLDCRVDPGSCKQKEILCDNVRALCVYCGRGILSDVFILAASICNRICFFGKCGNHISVDHYCTDGRTDVRDRYGYCTTDALLQCGNVGGTARHRNVCGNPGVDRDCDRGGSSFFRRGIKCIHIKIKIDVDLRSLSLHKKSPGLFGIEQDGGAVLFLPQPCQQAFFLDEN